MSLSLRAGGAAAVVVGVSIATTWGLIGGPAAVAHAGEQLKIEGDRGTAQEPKSTCDEPAAHERRAANVFRLLRDHPLSSDTVRIPQIEAALDETVDFKLEPQSLREALALFSKKFRIPILTDQRSLEDANIDLSREVKLDVANLPLRDTLELLLNLDGQPLSFEIRHGTLLVATLDKVKEDLETVIYDCRDLVLIGTLDRYPSGNGGTGAGCVGGMFQIQQPPAIPPAAPQTGAKVVEPSAPTVLPAGQASRRSAGPLRSRLAPVPPAKEVPQTARPEPRLPIVQTILCAVGRDEWEDGPTITELGGLIVVRQNRFNHDKIKILLADIRRMRATGAFAPSAKVYEDEVKRRVS